MTADPFQLLAPFTTLNGSSLPVAFFNFLRQFTNYTQDGSAAAAAAVVTTVAVVFSFSFQFPFPASGIRVEAHPFRRARGAIISSISVTSFIMREASDAQHFSLGLERSPDHSL